MNNIYIYYIIYIVTYILHALRLFQVTIDTYLVKAPTPLMLYVTVPNTPSSSSIACERTTTRTRTSDMPTNTRRSVAAHVFLMPSVTLYTHTPWDIIVLGATGLTEVHAEKLVCSLVPRPPSFIRLLLRVTAE